jgi:hypothetical protein
MNSTLWSMMTRSLPCFAVSCFDACKKTAADYPAKLLHAAALQFALWQVLCTVSQSVSPMSNACMHDDIGRAASSKGAWLPAT